MRGRDGTYTDPANYPRLSLAQPATHDHPPLAAAWADLWRQIGQGRNAAEGRRELRRFLDFAGLAGEKPPREFTDRLREGYLCRVLRSNSWLVVVMISDLFGHSYRFNTPGLTGSANWSQRFPATVSELEKDRRLLAQSKAFSALVRGAGRNGC